MVVDGLLATLAAVYLLAIRTALVASILWAARQSFPWPAAAALAVVVAALIPRAIGSVPLALTAIWCLVALQRSPPRWVGGLLVFGGGTWPRWRPWSSSTSAPRCSSSSGSPSSCCRRPGPQPGDARGGLRRSLHAAVARRGSGGRRASATTSPPRSRSSPATRRRCRRIAARRLGRLARSRSRRSRPRGDRVRRRRAPVDAPAGNAGGGRAAAVLVVREVRVRATRRRPRGGVLRHPCGGAHRPSLAGRRARRVLRGDRPHRVFVFAAADETLDRTIEPELAYDQLTTLSCPERRGDARERGQGLACAPPTRSTPESSSASGTRRSTSARGRSASSGPTTSWRPLPVIQDYGLHPRPRPPQRRRARRRGRPAIRPPPPRLRRQRGRRDRRPLHPFDRPGTRELLCGFRPVITTAPPAPRTGPRPLR